MYICVFVWIGLPLFPALQFSPCNIVSFSSRHSKRAQWQTSISFHLVWHGNVLSPEQQNTRNTKLAKVTVWLNQTVRSAESLVWWVDMEYNNVYVCNMQWSGRLVWTTETMMQLGTTSIFSRLFLRPDLYAQRFKTQVIGDNVQKMEDFRCSLNLSNKSTPFCFLFWNLFSHFLLLNTTMMFS